MHIGYEHHQAQTILCPYVKIQSGVFTSPAGGLTKKKSLDQSPHFPPHSPALTTRSAQQHALVRIHASVSPAANSGRPRESSVRKQGALHPVALQLHAAAGVCVGERREERCSNGSFFLSVPSI